MYYTASDISKIPLTDYQIDQKETKILRNEHKKVDKLPEDRNIYSKVKIIVVPNCFLGFYAICCLFEKYFGINVNKLWNHVSSHIYTYRRDNCVRTHDNHWQRQVWRCWSNWKTVPKTRIGTKKLLSRWVHWEKATPDSLEIVHVVLDCSRCSTKQM